MSFFVLACIVTHLVFVFRCDEGIKLKAGEVELGLLDERDGTPFHRYVLTWRKTNQDNPEKCEFIRSCP
jgi:hypothetical protein